METCEIVIVGGGPAGSSCARALVGSGLDVVVLDKAAFPRDKVCAGWITPAVVQELDLDLADYAAGRTLQPITGFRTGLMGQPPICTQYDRTVSYGIRRCEFDHYLLDHCGARLRLHEPLRSLRRESGDWIVNDVLRARCVVGAGGHFCPVARQSADDTPAGPPAVVAQEVEYELPPDEAAACRIEPALPELFFCDDLRGYAWCFRKGRFLNVGLGREGESHLAAALAEFAAWLHQTGRIASPVPDHARGHAYRLYRGRPRQPRDAGVLLIGDAAGLAYAQSGEGIRPAIESGLLAAGAIAEAGGDYGPQLTAVVHERLTARFGKPSRLPAGDWFPACRRALSRRLLANRWFTRRVLLDGWFLHRHELPLPAVPAVAQAPVTSSAAASPCGPSAPPGRSPG